MKFKDLNAGDIITETVKNKTGYWLVSSVSSASATCCIIFQKGENKDLNFSTFIMSKSREDDFEIIGTKEDHPEFFL